MLLLDFRKILPHFGFENFSRPRASYSAIVVISRIQTPSTPCVRVQSDLDQENYLLILFQSAFKSNLLGLPLDPFSTLRMY